MKRGGVLVIAMFCLAGCGSPSAQPRAGSDTTTPTPSVATSSTTTASAGDFAACKAYLRVEPDVNERLKVNLGGLPASLIADDFRRWADDLETGTVTATDSTLTASLKGTIGGLRSSAATADAWHSGQLDLRPDLTVVYEQSQKVAEACSSVDVNGAYVAMVNAG